MRLFSQEKVDKMMAEGQWHEGDWSRYCRDYATNRGDAVALIDPANRETLTDGAPRRLTWSEVDAEADRMAAVLFNNGIRPDDRVGIQLPNIVELAVIYIALARLGAIATPFPVQYREHEMTQLCQVARTRAFITATTVVGRSNLDEVEATAKAVDSLTTIFAIGDQVPDSVIDLTASPGDTADYQAHIASHTIAPNDCITLCWTSGTESIPKGIPRAFCDWGAAGSGCVDAPQLTADSTILCPFPLVNMGGLGGLFCPWILTGCTMVMHHPFDLPTFLQQCSAEGVDYTVMPPALLTRMLQTPEILDTVDLSRLKVIGTGSAPVPSSTVVGWAERGSEIINFFGSNEGLNLISDSTSVPDPNQRGFLFPSYKVDPETLRVRSARFTDVRLVDEATGEVIGETGRIGELRVAGPTVFSGYWEGTGKVGAFDENGFYRSGDLFEYYDADLTLIHYQGRGSDLIVRGGFNISPAEVENVLQSHPGIAEVAVVGVPDEELGDRVAAFVVTAGDATVDKEALVSYMEEHKVAKYKWPEFVTVIDELPRNPVGKVLHRDLRALFASQRADG